LAPLSAPGEPEVRRAIRRMKERLRDEERARELWTATRVLLGLNHPPDLVDILLRGVQGMKESSTYQQIVAEGRAEGRAEEARRFLKTLGQDKFGPPDEQAQEAIDAIEDIERLEDLGRRLLRVESWQELLAASPRRRRNGRRRTNR
jgi:predicted transposase YdaD